MEKVHLNKKYGNCLIISLIVCIGIQAQPYEWTIDYLSGSTFMNIIEIDGKYFGAVSTGARINFDPNVDYQLSIYEIDLENSGEPGFILHEISSTFYPEYYATIAVDYIHQIKKWIIVQSSFISEGYQNYRVILCSEDFEILNEQSIDTLGYPIEFHIDSYHNKTYVLGSIIAPPNDELFYMEFFHDDSIQLPPIQINQSEPKPMFWITSMNIDQQTGNMLVFYYNGIAILDSNLYQVKRFDHTSHIGTHDHGHLLRVGDNFYSHGAKRFDWQIGYRHLVVHKYDSSFNILVRDTLGWDNQDNYPFIHKSLMHRNGEIMVGGHLDGPFTHFDIYKSVKKFYLAKYDQELNRIWYREYGGDKAYLFYGLHILEDGSCLAYGFITDTIDGQRYAYIMHVDENGDILTSTTIPNYTNSIKVLNPGQENLQVLNPDDIVANIILYDINGCELIRKDLIDGLNEIPTGSLPQALYPYTIVSDGKYLSSGKWIKVKD